MTYRTFTAIAAALFVLVSWGCDNKSSKQQADAGADTAQTDNRNAAGSNSGNPQAAAGNDTGGQDPSRPSATADESGTITATPPLQTDGLLTPEDITELAEGGEFEKGPLPGIEASPSYNAHRIHPADGDGYGAGVQVWAYEDESTAAQRINELKSQYLNVEPAPKEAKTLGSSAFVSTRSGIKSLVFQTSEPSTRVIAISCSKKICKEADQLMELADKVGKRLKESDKKEE